MIRQDDGVTVTYKILDTNLVPVNEKPATPPERQVNLHLPANYGSKVEPSFKVPLYRDVVVTCTCPASAGSARVPPARAAARAAPPARRPQLKMAGSCVRGLLGERSACFGSGARARRTTRELR